MVSTNLVILVGSSAPVISFINERVSGGIEEGKNIFSFPLQCLEEKSKVSSKILYPIGVVCVAISEKKTSYMSLPE